MKSSRILISVLLIGLVHALLYVILVPPWQHYDEPAHFEYVWLIANRDGLPQPTDSDPAMRAEVQRSMLENGFFDHIGDPPAPNESGAWIGPAPQLVNRPLYYALAAVPVRWLGDAPVTRQLYGARLVSMLFLLVTIAAGWGIAAELTPAGHWLRLALPASLALLPGFVDVMTAVNNDSMAVAFSALAIWASVRLVRRKLNWMDLLLGLVAAVGCVFSKESAFFCLPGLLLAVWLSAFPPRFELLSWLLLGVVGIFGLVYTLELGDASLWYRSTSQPGFTSEMSAQAVHGNRVFAIYNSYEVTPRWLDPVFQPVPVGGNGFESGKTYTLGGWIWADQPLPARSPYLGDGNTLNFLSLQVDKNPQFFAQTVTPTGFRLWVSLEPTQRPAPGVYYYDGLVLAEGVRPADSAPVFDDRTGSTGTWGGEPFVNLLRNPSAEQLGPRIRPVADSLGAEILPDHIRPSVLLTYLSDWRGAGWYYRATSESLLNTFWAKFGWGHVPLPGSNSYPALILATILGAAGAVIALIRAYSRAGDFPWSAIAVLCTTLLVAWLGTFTRGAIYLGIWRLYIPVARSAFTAIVPTLLVLCVGWFTLLKPLARRLPGERARVVFPYAVVLAFFLILDIASIIAIVTYY